MDCGLDSRQSPQKEEMMHPEDNIIDTNKLKKLIDEALWTEGDYHKQWYLWEIAKELGFDKFDFVKKEYPEGGIIP